MRLREAVASVLHLLVILTYFGAACFFILLPLRLEWRMLGATWLQEQPDIFYWIGASIGIIGLFLSIGFYRVGRGRFLRLSMKPHTATIDVKLLEQAIEECFQTHFAAHVRGSDIAIISKQRLEIAVDMLPIEEKRQKKLMIEMEQKLGSLLRDRFGYARPFTLSIHSK